MAMAQAEPAAAATTAPAEPSAQTTEVPTASPEADPASAQEESAQDDTLYEGALAGLSEEEIAKLALAEEESSERHDEDGAEGAVD